MARNEKVSLTRCSHDPATATLGNSSSSSHFGIEMAYWPHLLIASPAAPTLVGPCRHQLPGEVIPGGMSISGTGGPDARITALRSHLGA
jgi:hypothetical protein